MRKTAASIMRAIVTAASVVEDIIGTTSSRFVPKKLAEVLGVTGAIAKV
jgi:hypothetical protein